MNEKAKNIFLDKAISSGELPGATRFSLLAQPSPYGQPFLKCRILFCIITSCHSLDVSFFLVGT